MRIIKRGTIPEEREYQAKCKHCNTLFAFKLSETSYKWARNIMSTTVKCPLCGQYVTKEI